MTAGSRSTWKLRSGWICRRPTTITPPVFPLPTATLRFTNGWAQLAYRRCSTGRTEPGPRFPAAIQTWCVWLQQRTSGKYIWISHRVGLEASAGPAKATRSNQVETERKNEDADSPATGSRPPTHREGSFDNYELYAFLDSPMRIVCCSDS